MNSKDIGERTEAQVLAAFLRRGDIVLLPFGDNQRYDLALDDNGKLIRVQCKTGRLRDGAVRFKACSTYAHRGRKSKSYKGQIELFGVYCMEIDKIYLVPVDDVGIREGILRIVPPRNNQGSKIRWAKDYEI